VQPARLLINRPTRQQVANRPASERTTADPLAIAQDSPPGHFLPHYVLRFPSLPLDKPPPFSAPLYYPRSASPRDAIARKRFGTPLAPRHSPLFPLLLREGEPGDLKRPGALFGAAPLGWSINGISAGSSRSESRESTEGTRHQSRPHRRNPTTLISATPGTRPDRTTRSRGARHRYAVFLKILSSPGRTPARRFVGIRFGYIGIGYIARYFTAPEID
jgi:hypothetical protein